MNKIMKVCWPKNRSRSTPGSSFEQTIMRSSPQCYIPNFMEIGSLVPEKIFEGFLPYMGVGGHLGHVTSIMFGEEFFLKGFYLYVHGGHLGHVTSTISTNYYFHVHKSLHTKFG